MWWRQLAMRFREFLTGLTRVSYGSCGGDPIAWENDLLRQRREREALEWRREDSGGLREPLR